MKAKPFAVTISLLGGMLVAGGLGAADSPAVQPTPPAVTYVDAPDPATAGKPAEAPMQFTFIDSDDASVEEIAQFGSKTIEHIGSMLIAQVSHELATNETSLAVSIMHLKNLELPKPVPGQPTITAIRRTSLLLRDPHNAPDAADRAALDLIHTQLMADQTPSKMLVQRVEHPGLPVEWRVYRPIAALPSCLACHGDPKTFRPGVKDALDRLYPEDKASDYVAHEWRGVIRVSIAPAEPVAK
jgi:hypothetical protein